MRLFEFTEAMENLPITEFLSKVTEFGGNSVMARAAIGFIVDTAHVTNEDSESRLILEINATLAKYNIPLMVKYIDVKRKEIWFNEN